MEKQKQEVGKRMKRRRRNKSRKYREKDEKETACGRGGVEEEEAPILGKDGIT